MAKWTLDELAKYTGRDKRTVANWRRDGMPILDEKRGRSLLVDSAEFFRWWGDYRYRSGELKKAAQETDWTAEKRKIEVLEKRGELLDRADVVHTWNDLVAGIRKMVLSIPNRCAGLVAQKSEAQARAILDGEVKLILREAVQYDEKRRREIDDAG